MGPAVLITIGLLFLVSNMSDWPFHRTWPILLIVIGAVNVVRYVMSDETHINPGQYPPPYGVPYGQVPPPGGPYAAGYAPPQPDAPVAPVMTAEIKQQDAPAQNGDGEVNHG
jgi:hypothetical protein